MKSLKVLPSMAIVAMLMSAGISAQTAQTPPAEKEKSWKCAVTTEGAQLIWSKYSGGDWANIHIAPFNRPGSYKVTKEGDDVVKGQTSNDTKFECRLA